ncbi:monocarboxylate transporter [Elysia marginata]|uniref:Monocarboxylate transporter n=1 Tax=Elysia marginata TaxID=1093978 RepID=A0AAV4GH59_9GAST|nr:monocarboxylate transporter [Elysia marginata]
MFWYVLIGNFVVMLGYYVPFVYISDRAVAVGIDETQAAFLLSIIVLIVVVVIALVVVVVVKVVVAVVVVVVVVVNKMFWYVLIGNFVVMLGYYVPFVYISDRAVAVGIDETQAAFLLSIIGASSLISRALTGVMMHFWRVDTVLASALSLIATSLSVAACPLLDSFSMMALSAALFGFFSAVPIALCSVLLCDILGINNLANAFGYVILLRGVGSTLGPPLAGAIIDATGRFDEAFFMGGLVLFLGGLCHLLLYIIYLSPCRRCFGVGGHRVTYIEEPETDRIGHGAGSSADRSVERV